MDANDGSTRCGAPPHPSAEKGKGIPRRQLLRLAAGGGLLLIGAGTALLGGGRAPRLYRASRVAMGTTATILLAHASRETAVAAMAAAFSEIARVESLMSRFRAESDIGRLNALPGHWHRIHPDTAAVLKMSLRVARTCDGTFDPCLERLVDGWGFYDRRFPMVPPQRTGRPPGSEEFFRALEVRGRSGEGYSARLSRPEVGVDLGGIAKGYGIDRAASALREAGVTSALLNVGGDIFALGSHPSGTPWRVGVRHPRNGHRLLEVISLRNEAVATSGDYLNFFVRNGKRFAHVINPSAGRPADTHQSFTVTASTAMMADAIATAAFTVEPLKVAALMNRGGVRSWLAVDATGHTYGTRM